MVCVVEDGACCAEALEAELIDRVLWLINLASLTEFCAAVRYGR